MLSTERLTDVGTLASSEPARWTAARAACWTARVPGIASFAAVVLFIAIFVGQGVAFIQANSQTYDEAMHLAAGYSYLRTGDFRLAAETPPLIKELAALAVYLRYRLPFQPNATLWKEANEWEIGLDFLYGSAAPPEAILATARGVNLALGTILVGLIGWWSCRLWGPPAAALATGLAALEPNLVAHSGLVSTDVGVTLFDFATLYLLWECVRRPSQWVLAACGISMGLAMASKFSALLLVGIVGAVVALILLAGGTLSMPGNVRPRDRFWARAGQAAAALLRLFFWAAITLVAAYFIYGFGAWGRGLHIHWAHEKAGHESFFLGDYSCTGWWSYFPVAVSIKTPVGTSLLVIASLLLCRAGKPLGRQEAIFLLVPPLLFLSAMTLARIHIGVRHALVLYPFLFVTASRLVTVRSLGSYTVPGLRPVLIGVPLAMTALSALRSAPHQLAYFNELVGGSAAGPLYLSDSNVDWGQDLKGLKQFMDDQGVPVVYLSYFGTAPPAAYGISYHCLPGIGQFRPPPPDPGFSSRGRDLVAISAVNLQGVYLTPRDRYRWLSNREPLARIGGSIYVYDVTGDADAHRRLARLYRDIGLNDLATAEDGKALDRSGTTGSPKRP